MKILSWNCRGFSKTTTVHRCRKLVQQFSPDFIFLSETKLLVSQAAISLVNLGYESFVGTDAVNLGGGTLLAWTRAMVVDVIELCPSVCHCKVKINGLTPFYYLSCVYGPPNASFRQNFWNWISSSAQSIDSPWLLIGDFNEDRKSVV